MSYAIDNFGLEFFKYLEDISIGNKEEFINEIVPDEYQTDVWKYAAFQDNIPLMFRGVRQSLGDVVTVSTPKYKMDKSGVQNSLVLFFDHFMKKAGFRATPTNSIFCTRSLDVANRYRYDSATNKAHSNSTIYLVFPLQENQYTFSFSVDDYIELYFEMELFYLGPTSRSLQTRIDEMFQRVIEYMGLPKWVAEGAAEIMKNNELFNVYKEALGPNFNEYSGNNFCLFHLWYVLLKHFNKIPEYSVFRKKYRSGAQVFQDLIPQIGRFMTDKLGYAQDPNDLDSIPKEHEIMVNGKVLMISLEYIEEKIRMSTD